MAGTAHVHVGDKCSKINETKRHRMCVGLEIKLDKQREKPHLTIFYTSGPVKNAQGRQAMKSEMIIILLLHCETKHYVNCKLT